MTQQISTLPTLQELTQDVSVAFKNDQLNLLLNQEPPANWIKDHPYARDNKGVPVKYLPVDKVEYLLTKIFQQWKPTVLREGQLFNSVYVAVRIEYMNPTDGKWYHTDGLGAVGIQTDAGATAADMSKIKQDAVMKALPAAESYALKDAAEKLGKIFGKDLNRKDTVGFTPTFTEEDIPDNPDNLPVHDMINGMPDKGELDLLVKLAFSSTLNDEDRSVALQSINTCTSYARYQAIQSRLEILQPSFDEIHNPSQTDIKKQVAAHV